MEHNETRRTQLTPSRVRIEARQPSIGTAQVSLQYGDASGSEPCTGIALDESASGLCLQLPVPVPVGALLDITLRDASGKITREEITRVTWCRPRDGGRYNAGVAVVGEALCIEYARRETVIEVSPDS